MTDLPDPTWGSPPPGRQRPTPEPVSRRVLRAVDSLPPDTWLIIGVVLAGALLMAGMVVRGYIQDNSERHSALVERVDMLESRVATLESEAADLQKALDDEATDRWTRDREIEGGLWRAVTDLQDDLDALDSSLANLGRWVREFQP